MKSEHTCSPSGDDQPTLTGAWKSSAEMLESASLYALFILQENLRRKWRLGLNLLAVWSA